jgi:vacuolar-type H+-ATPase subunit B/Vma2
VASLNPNSASQEAIVAWLQRNEQQAYHIYVDQERRLVASIDAETKVLRAYWRARDNGAGTPLLRAEAMRAQDALDSLYAQVRTVRARLDALDEAALLRMQAEEKLRLAGSPAGKPA